MPAITHKRMMQIIRERPGTNMVSITTQTEHKLKKSWSGGKITKISKVNGILGYNYENAVNNQKEREGQERNFQAEQRSWGTRIDNFFVSHKGNTYLTIKIQSTDKPLYIDSDGNEIDPESFREHEYARSSSSRQGVEKQIIHREYKMSSIINITMNGETYTLIHV